MEIESGTRVVLSSGDHFYVRADAKDVLAVLSVSRRFVRLGGRDVNPAQVVELSYGPIPSVEIPEALA